MININENTSPIRFGEMLIGLDVIKVIKGFLLRHQDKVQGVLVISPMSGTLTNTPIVRPSPTAQRFQAFTEEFSKLINEARLELDDKHTRIVLSVHIKGLHYITVAYDRTENKAIIVEPMVSDRFEEEITLIKSELIKIFEIPGFAIEISKTKIQHDGWSCGFISSKLAEHF